MTAVICHRPRSGRSRLANPTATRAAGTRLSNRPPTAPQAANRGSDNSSNLRRRPAVPSTTAKSTPPTKPGIASAGNGASNTSKKESQNGRPARTSSYFVPNSTLTKRRTPNSVRVEAQLLRWRRFRRRALLQRSQQSDS